MLQRSILRTLPACSLMLAAGVTTAQATVPSWSSRFGGNGYDEIVAILRGPGNRLTLVGHTTSTNLPLGTGPVLQSTNAGNADVFVACLDASSQSLLWCTYLGGSDLDLAFDAVVEPATGVTTVVGLSLSTNFPAPVGQPSPIRNGPSDGFLVRLDANGAALLTSTFLGGPAHDRLCEVEVDPASSGFFVAGVTETQLPQAWSQGTVFPSYRGGLSDAFIARIGIGAATGTATVAWATHLGGSSTDGMPFASWGGLGVQWEGNLDRMALAIDAAGQPVLATASFQAGTPAPTTPNAVQPTHGGQGDCYVAIVRADGLPPLAYGTFHGGSLDERPRAIAPHPAGGFVIGGTTYSSDLPMTLNCLQPVFRGGTLGGATDAFVCHIDPQLGSNGRLYSTYFGGSNGEDSVLALAVESSGVVTVAGMTAGGNFWTTPRCLQGACATTQWTGFVASMALGSAADLHYGTYLEFTAAPAFTETLVNRVVLDEVGDVYFAGATSSPNYPQQNPLPIGGGGRDGVFTCMPLLAGGISRDGFASATAACAGPLYGSAHQAPLPGTVFTLTATGAPANWLGLLALGMQLPLPGVVLPPPWGGTLLVTPDVLATVTSNALGAAQYPLAIPASLPTPSSWGLSAQWFFFTNPSCPGTGLLANSERLNF